jgi:hypothetical protein
MPVENSTVIVKQLGTAGASPSATYPSVNAVGGKLRIAVVPYLVSATLATNDTINLVSLPSGATVLPHLSYVIAEDPGTALTIDIGFASNLDALSDGLDLAAGGNVAFTAGGTATAQQFAPVPLAKGDETIIVDCKLVTSVTAGKKITFFIAYLFE